MLELCWFSVEPQLRVCALFYFIYTKYPDFFVLRKCAGSCEEMSRKVYSRGENIIIPGKL